MSTDYLFFAPALLLVLVGGEPVFGGGPALGSATVPQQEVSTLRRDEATVHADPALRRDETNKASTVDLLDFPEEMRDANARRAAISTFASAPRGR